MQRLERNKYELSLIENAGNDKAAIDKIQDILRQEEEKL